MEQCCSVKACVKAAHRKLLSLGGVGAFYPSQRAVLLVYQPPIYWNIANYVVAIIKEDGCHCQRRWLPCESQRGLLVQHLQPLDIVKEGGYNGGLLVVTNNHCLMSKFGKFGSHHC